MTPESEPDEAALSSDTETLHLPDEDQSGTNAEQSDTEPDLENTEESDPQPMDRLTIRFPPRQADEIEQLVNAGVYPSQSEVVRAAVRQLLQSHRQPATDAD